MTWIALRMLVGSPLKYLSIVLGVGFASLLISQQSSIFWGLMRLTGSQIRDVRGVDIWVMDPNVRFVDDLKPLSNNDLHRIRGVSGVRWAAKFYKGLCRARLEGGDYQQMIMLGVDDDALIGAPQEVLAGSLDALRQPDAIFIDDAGYEQLWPNQPYTLGKAFEMNDHRAVLVGVAKAGRTFQTFPVVYARYSQAIRFVPQERKVMSFVLVKVEPNSDASEVSRRIEQQTGLKALTQKEFIDLTFWYYAERTGIPINFGITVLLGLIVGTAVAGLTFYLFTVENLTQFGALKAMGTTNIRLLWMVMLQAAVAGILGYSLGVGAAAWFGWRVAAANAKLAFFMTPEILVITGLAVMLIVMASSVLSIWRVLVVEPAIVFKG